MRVVLVTMPWAVVEFPSIAHGILKRRLADTLPQAEVEVLYANLEYATWAAEEHGITAADYKYFVDSYALGFGDWVFAASLHGTDRWRVEEFTDLAAGQIPSRLLALGTRLQEATPAFVDALARRLVATEPTVVAFTSTFQQNAASLALARRIKDLAPRTVTVFGGANCDGVQGAALHRAFPFVDFVVRGEGEIAFPELLRRLGTGEPLTDIPGLCLREGTRTIAVEMQSRPLPPGQMVTPDYDDYFPQWNASRAAAWSPPVLVVEAARGCWWGEKHHCTFCGLNGSLIQFRSKSPAIFYDEIIDMAGRYRILDFLVVDNILDMAYLGSLLPRLASSGHDLRFHYEIKANLRLDQLRTLAAAGLVAVQPGIESLSTRVLKLMDKGVTGCQNVAHLRDAATAGVTPVWNYLYGFPGETDADYDGIIDQLPRLHHLMPPTGVNRIMIERFSPYFDDPSLGFAERRPDPRYALIYDLPPAELEDFAYVFDVPPAGVGPQTVKRLEEAVTEWAREAPASRLTHCDLGESIVLVNTRAAYPWTVHTLSTPAELALFRLLDRPHTPESLARKLPDAPVAALLADWHALGLLFEDDGRVVHVVPESVNEELLRRGAARWI
ncbi:RiPP maturation radical SAM C-methyltransferase [Actinocorallia sp. B10E7]|uniref:RiPP maturation radical SAM C-methyltransferase n=1 Tax=Actinocorallia sp. B10E7 TaxID=3153558 RepID=UPI00325E2ECD